MGFGEAALAEPLSVLLHGVRLTRVRTGDRALVLGCGTIGLLTLVVLARSGMSAIHTTDPVEIKRRWAHELGGDQVHDRRPASVHVHQIMGRLGPDVVFECVGIPATLREAMNHVRKSGQVLVLGVCMEPAPILPMLWKLKELEIRGSYAAGEKYDLALEWLAKGWVPQRKFWPGKSRWRTRRRRFDLCRGPTGKAKSSS